jgi:choline dehydrogenase
LVNCDVNNATQGQTLPYEYVAVGSGAGGGTVAAKLATYGKRVLLIEAGDDEGDKLNTTVPVFHPYPTEDSDLAWNFYVRHYENETQAVQDDKMTWVSVDGQLFVGRDPPPGSKTKGI